MGSLPGLDELGCFPTHRGMTIGAVSLVAETDHDEGAVGSRRVVVWTSESERRLDRARGRGANWIPCGAADRLYRHRFRLHAAEEASDE